MNEDRFDEGQADPPTRLERLSLPFVVHDALPEPLPSFMVVRLIFDRPVDPDSMDRLQKVLDAWLARQAAAALARGELEPEPEGEALQMGDQTVEFQIHGALGCPDSTLEPMLEALAQLHSSGQRIVLVEMD